MKKLLLTAIVVLSMSLASFADNGSASPFNYFGNDTESIEKVKPHTQQYQDIKKILDEYEQEVNNAKTCDELESAAMNMFLKLLATTENEYKEDMTKEEEEELSAMMDKIDKKVTQLQKQWGCETEDDEEAEPAVELNPTTSEEWEKILDDFDALTKKLEGMKGLDLDDEENLDVLLEFIFEAQPLLEKIEKADDSTLTDRQRERFENIAKKFESIAKQMGMIE